MAWVTLTLPPPGGTASVQFLWSGAFQTIPMTLTSLDLLGNKEECFGDEL